MDMRKLVKSTRLLSSRSTKSNSMEFEDEIQVTDVEDLLYSEDVHNYLRIQYSESEADDATQVMGHLEYRRYKIFFTDIKLPEWRETRYLKIQQYLLVVWKFFGCSEKAKFSLYHNPELRS